jgi:hypothetical protein
MDSIYGQLCSGVSVMTDIVLDSPPIASTAKQWWKNIKAAFRFSKASEDQASFHMFRLARTNLGVRLRAIDETSLSEAKKNIYAAVAEMLKAPTDASATAQNFDWDEIYKAESLIALLYGGEQLRHEIEARLQELATEDQTDADNLRRDNQELLKQPIDGSNPGLDDSMLCVFLLRVLEAVHWNAKQKYLARPIRVQATNRILFCLLVSFVLLIAPYGFVVLDYDAGTSVHKIWSLLPLYTALTAGLLGAFSSRLYGIQRQWANMNLDEVFLQREWPYTLLRAGVGLCGALVAYIFLRSGIAEGALFPKFASIRIELVNVTNGDTVSAVEMAYAMPSKDLALLTFWCFLAGFSETLVSNILKSTEQEFTDGATRAQASQK